MMNKAAILLLSVLLMAFLPGNPIGAQDTLQTSGWDIYVRNQPIEEDYVDARGSVYVPADDFLKALRFGYTQGDDGIVHISSSPGDYGSVTTVGGTISFEYQDATFKVPFKSERSHIFVDLAQMTKNLGVTYMVNADTRIIDVVVPQGMTSAQYNAAREKALITGAQQAGETAPATGETKETPSQGSTEQGGTTTAQAKEPDKEDKEKEESPIKQVGDVGGFMDERTGQGWWTVTLKNSGDQLVTNVVITLHIKDAEGKDFDTQVKPVGNMNPGDEQKVEFYYQTSRLRIIKPEAEIKHDPLPKKEEKGATPSTPAPQKEEKGATK